MPTQDPQASLRQPGADRCAASWTTFPPRAGTWYMGDRRTDEAQEISAAHRIELG
jgi:hypothetical protein